MYISVEHVNEDRHYRFGDSEPFECDAETPGEVYKAMMSQYGRCISKMFVDSVDGKKSKHIGWVFEKRMKYDDSNDTFKCHTWVSLHEKPPTVQIHYMEL